MAVKIRVQQNEKDGQVLNIDLSGKLDISSYGEFGAYKSYLEGSGKIVLDMSELEYLDSSALGMLLMLRERAGGPAANIEIVNCSPTIFKILSTVKFDKIFNLAQPGSSPQNTC